MKLRELLKRLRLQSVQIGEGERKVDNVDALASGLGPKGDVAQGDVAAMAPPGWVPSQQDERPHH